MDRVSGTIDELVVPYDPSAVLNRVQRWRRMLRSRLISLGISVVVLILIFIWQHDRFLANPLASIVVYAIVLLAAVGWAVGYWIAYRRARRVAATLGQGVALRVNRAGIEVVGRMTTWPELASLTTAKGSWPSGPVLQVNRVDGSRAEVPLEQLHVLPATLDTTVRAYSGGRHGLDLSALDI
jgi:hypothetical protein